MVLELVHGPTVEEALTAQKPNGRCCFAEIDTTKIISSVLHGLQAVHDSGLVHRDLKPANIALREPRPGSSVLRSSAELGGLPVSRPGACGVSLLDFGLARASSKSGGSATAGNKLPPPPDMAETLLEHTHHQRGHVGTPHYMAPEAWQQTSHAAGGGGSKNSPATEQRQVDCRADLWAVGVMLFRLLTGVLPFAPGQTDVLLIRQEVTGFRPAPDVQAAAPSGQVISSGVAGFVARSLRKRPEDRFQSAAEMQHALYAALVQSDAARYGGFISYRVRADAALALALHGAASQEAGPGGPVVYLDRVALVDGARWDRGFLGGLGRTDVFVPLVTLAALEPLFEIGESTCDRVDNVLLEYTVAIALFNAGRLKAIMPVLAGKPKSDDGAGVAAGAGAGAGAGPGVARAGWTSLSAELATAKAAGRYLPDTPHPPTARRAAEALAELGVCTPEQSQGLVESLTVRAVVETLLLFQGVRLSASETGPAAVTEAAHRLVKAANGHKDSATALALPPLSTSSSTAGSGGGGHAGCRPQWPLSPPSLAEMLQCRQKLFAAEKQIAAQASQLAELGAQAREVKQNLAAELAAFAAFKKEHSDAYRCALIAELHAENAKLSVSASKWRAAAEQQAKEMAKLRQTNTMLAGQATETRRVAYQIAAGHRVNANTPARLGLRPTTTAGARHSGRITPATPGSKAFRGGSGGDQGGGRRGGGTAMEEAGGGAAAAAATAAPLPAIQSRPSAAALQSLQNLAALRATCIGSAPAGANRTGSRRAQNKRKSAPPASAARAL
eukprot:SAG22_NODE_708_length_7748_cov_3.772650_2_plen_787_part_00